MQSVSSLLLTNTQIHDGKMLGFRLSKNCLVSNYTVPTRSSQETKPKTFANENELIFLKDLANCFIFYKYGFNPKLKYT